MQGAELRAEGERGQKLESRALDGLDSLAMYLDENRYSPRTRESYLSMLEFFFRYIQELLGHKSTRTTEIYTHVSRRNPGRFPDDSMFELNNQVFDGLRSQIVTSSWGGARYLPMAFTEQGVAMLSSVL